MAAILQATLFIRITLNFVRISLFGNKYKIVEDDDDAVQNQ